MDRTGGEWPYFPQRFSEINMEYRKGKRQWQKQPNCRFIDLIKIVIIIPFKHSIKHYIFDYKVTNIIEILNI